MELQQSSSHRRRRSRCHPFCRVLDQMPFYCPAHTPSTTSSYQDPLSSGVCGSYSVHHLLASNVQQNLDTISAISLTYQRPTITSIKVIWFYVVERSPHLILPLFTIGEFSQDLPIPQRHNESCQAVPPFWSTHEIQVSASSSLSCSWCLAILHVPVHPTGKSFY